MRAFSIYVHPDFSYQPYEAYHAKQHLGASSVLASVPSTVKAAAAVTMVPLVVAGASVALWTFAPHTVAEISKAVGLEKFIPL